MKVTPGKRFTLCSPDELGSLDYTTSVILLNTYSAQDRKLIRSALKPGHRKNRLTPSEKDAYNLCIHEYTHYLDLTTTVWGTEFLYRRNAALPKLSAQGKSAASVVMLNITEIMMHEVFNRVHHKAKLENLVTKHRLHHCETYGSLVIVLLYKDGELIAETAFSMLSVLEANAIANEYEGEYKWVACRLGGLDRFQESRIDAKFKHLLEDSGRLEYNIVHILIAIHFPNLTVRRRLKLAATLCHLALDMSSLNLAMLANVINDFVSNKWLGDALCNDLCRGMSRHVVVFYFILMLYGYTNDIGLTAEQLSERIETSARQLIDEMLLHWGVEYPLSEGLSDREFQFCIKSLRKECGKERGKFMLPRSLQAATYNRKIRKTSLSTSQAFRRFKLPDLLLDDTTRVRAPSRIRANVLRHWDAMYDECNALDQLVTDSEAMRKFHMKPGAYGPMQLRREDHFMQQLAMTDNEP
ncbi:hypothetical protein D3C77_210620 [compost metagenome]